MSDPEPASPVPSGREVIERVTLPTGEWQLQRRDGHYEIICNGVFLMASYNQASNRHLAALALEHVCGENLRVLVGGLGIGYTAQAALEDSRVTALEVVELESLIVRWHRAYFAALCQRPLDDPRTTLTQSDLADLTLGRFAYDAILLDTDNGPRWLVRDGNVHIYTRGAVQRYLSALRPGGAVAFWSADAAPEFAEMLADEAGSVQAVEVIDEIAPGRPGAAWIYLAGRTSRGLGAGGSSGPW